MTRILIVEDNELNRDMLGRRLSRRGYDISTVENGQKALDFLNENLVDLIVMDMRMPVMDGWIATEKIKANELTKDLPIIGLSANAMQEDKEKALKAGCCEYETKPVDFSRLVGLIEQYCTPKIGLAGS
ncbi:MAG: response regulator [Pseudobacteriovorax sp.]|nr:response regulator [Pseudobacteriovorax sp.]